MSAHSGVSKAFGTGRVFVAFWVFAERRWPPGSSARLLQAAEEWSVLSVQEAFVHWWYLEAKSRGDRFLNAGGVCS
jgi:hypothetical protein